MSKKALVPVTTRRISLTDLEVMPATPAPPTDGWQRARKWVDDASAFERCKVACQVMAGFELLALRKEHGTNQGKRTDLATSPNHSEKLDWPELVKERLNISADTARNWMAMAEAAKPRMKKIGGVEVLGPILAKPSIDWLPDEAEKVSSTIHKISDGKTQLDFMRELGLVKKEQGSGVKGGHKPAANPSSVEEDSDEHVAVDLWTPILKGIALEGIRDKSWVDLPDKGEISRETLEGLIIDLGKLLREAKPARK